MEKESESERFPTLHTKAISREKVYRPEEVTEGGALNVVHYPNGWTKVNSGGRLSHNQEEEL